MNQENGLGIYTTNPGQVGAARFALLACLAISLVTALSGQGKGRPTAIKTWTGQAGGDWSEAVNWSPSGVPANGNALVFGPLPAGHTKTTNNDLAAPHVFWALSFQDDGYSISGKAIGVARGILASQPGSANTISCDLAMMPGATVWMRGFSSMLTIEGQVSGATSKALPNTPRPHADTLLHQRDNAFRSKDAALVFNLGKRSTVALKGKVTGNTGLRKTGDGVLALSGNNDFSGATNVLRGTLTVASARALGRTSAATIVHPLGRLVTALPDDSSLAEPLELSGGALQVVGGRLTWKGAVSVGNGTFDCPTGSTLRVEGVISGTGGFTKTGTGELQLMSANTYKGQTVLEEGTVRVGAVAALGSPTQGTLVKGSAILSLGGYSGFPRSLDIADEPLEFAGPDASLYYFGLMTWRGSIGVAAGASGRIRGKDMQGGQEARLDLPGSLWGTGDLTFCADNSLFSVKLGGSSTNCLTGVTKVMGGRVYLHKSAGSVAIAGPLEIRGYETDSGVGALVDCDADDQIEGPSQTSITLYNGGQLLLNGHKAHTRQLFMNGGSVHPGQEGQLVMGNESPAIAATGGIIDHDIEGVVWAGCLADSEIEVTSGILTIGSRIMNDAETFSKTGAGTLQLIGGNNAASVFIDEGVLQADGTRAYSVDIGDRGILAGSGVVGPVTANGGTIRPSIPSLAVEGKLDLTGSQIEISLNGPNPTDCSRIRVKGSVLLDSPTIKVASGFLPAVGTTFVIIENDGTEPVAGLPADAQIVVSGTAPFTFQIGYTGGDGNDVVLTRR